MDKVIRISSNQGFSDTWTNAAAPNSLNLCDFVMPSGNYDLSKSYIAFNASITSNDPNPMNATMYLDTDNGEKLSQFDEQTPLTVVSLECWTMPKTERTTLTLWLATLVHVVLVTKPHTFLIV